jgi:hypothetical protein
MTLSRAIRQIRDIAAIVLFAALIVLANQAYYVLEDFRKTEAQATQTMQAAEKSIQDTSSMVNANLIHLDLILGDAARVSSQQEAYWQMMSHKSALLLDNANTALINLDSSETAISTQAIQTLQETQNSIFMLGQTVQHTDTTINGPEIKQILSNVDKGTASLASSSAHVDAATKDVAEQVHSITHPKLITKVATWALRVVHAIGSWF